MRTCHDGEMFSALDARRMMTTIGENLQVAARATPGIQNFERRWTRHRPKESLDVLADIMIAGTLPKRFGVLIVMIDSGRHGLLKIFRTEFHKYFNILKNGPSSTAPSRLSIKHDAVMTFLPFEYDRTHRLEDKIDTRILKSGGISGHVMDASGTNPGCFGAKV
jgi:hypothetical protein